MENLVNNTNRPRGRPSSGKAKIVKSKNNSLKVGMIVKYKNKDQNTWHIAKLKSRTGKCNGKYKKEWNTVSNCNNEEIIDF